MPSSDSTSVRGGQTPQRTCLEHCNNNTKIPVRRIAIHCGWSSPYICIFCLLVMWCESRFIHIPLDKLLCKTRVIQAAPGKHDLRRPRQDHVDQGYITSVLETLDRAVGISSVRGVEYFRTREGGSVGSGQQCQLVDRTVRGSSLSRISSDEPLWL